MSRWLGFGLLLAVLLGILGCDRPQEPIQLDQPISSNRIPILKPTTKTTTSARSTQRRP
jgi:hypothetical protein